MYNGDNAYVEILEYQNDTKNLEKIFLYWVKLMYSLRKKI